MKKLATLLLLSTVALAGCSIIQRSLRGDDYFDSSLAAEESSKAAAQSAKELNDALTNENANFPQLPKEVAEDEAEVILHTSQGDILSLIHISEPTRLHKVSRMPSSA